MYGLRKQAQLCRKDNYCPPLAGGIYLQNVYTQIIRIQIKTLLVLYILKIMLSSTSLFLLWVCHKNERKAPIISFQAVASQLVPAITSPPYCVHQAEPYHSSVTGLRTHYNPQLVQGQQIASTSTIPAIWN